MSSSVPPDRAPEVVALGIPLLIIPTLAVVLRVWSRMLLSTSGSSRARGLWWDDWLVMISLPLSLATTALDLSWTTFGLGRHLPQVSPADFKKGLKVQWAIFWLYIIAIWLSKLSALAFYARVFSPGNRRFRLILWIVAGLSSAWLVGVLVSLILQCNPVQEAWQRVVRGACDDPYNWWLATDTSNFLVDLIVLLIPLPMLWRLQVKPIRKGLIFGVFISGYSVVFVSLGHVVETIREKPPHGVVFLEDFTWDLIPSGKWLSVESPIAIICLCLPSIFALVKKGVDDGPRALFLPAQRTFSVHSYTDRVTMLRQASDDGNAFDNTNLYALNLRQPAMSTASNVTASGGHPSSDGSRKTAGATLHGPNVIHIQTEINIETRSTWGGLLGVNI